MKMCNCKHALGYEEETGCAVCGHDGCEYNDTIEQLTARISTLEQQYAKLRDAYNGLVFVNNELEQQIQHAEQRGYVLCATHGWVVKVIDGKNVAQILQYEQAIAERDNIAEGSKMVGGEKK